MPEEQAKQGFDMAAFLKTPYIVVEETGLNEYVRSVWEAENRQRGHKFVLLYAKSNEKDKDARITTSLRPLFVNGHILLNPTKCTELKRQLNAHPCASGRKDIIDALSLVAQLPKLGLGYFTPPVVFGPNTPEPFGSTEPEVLAGWRRV